MRSRKYREVAKEEQKVLMLGGRGLCTPWHRLQRVRNLSWVKTSTELR